MRDVVDFKWNTKIEAVGYLDFYLGYASKATDFIYVCSTGSHNGPDTSNDPDFNFCSTSRTMTK